jgi:hypothetical protein
MTNNTYTGHGPTNNKSNNKKLDATRINPIPPIIVGNTVNNTTNNSIQDMFNNSLNETSANNLQVARRVLNESNLDKVVREAKEYYEANGSSSTENLPSLDSSNLVDKSEDIISIFSIFSDIYNKLFKDDKSLDIKDLNVTSLTEEAIKHKDFSKMSEEMQTIITEAAAKTKSGLFEKIIAKPFGELGDMTINEIVNKAFHTDISTFMNNVELAVKPLKIVPALYVYGRLVHMYVTKLHPVTQVHAMPNPAERLQHTKIRHFHIGLFMGIIAPISTLLLLNLTGSSITDAISFKIGVASASEIEKMEIALLLLTSSLPPSNKIFNSNNKDKNLKNGNKKFKWLILVLIILVFIFVIFNYNLINVFNFLISTRFLLSISLISSFLGIIYNSSFLFFYNLFYNNKNIKIVDIKPKFLKTFLTGIKEVSLSNTFSYDYQNKLFKWHIKFYSISFVLLSLYLIIF